MSAKTGPQLTLGCAQLGMVYGRANQTGRPNRADANRIIRTAVRSGIRSFDTARAYGDSESVVGEALCAIDTAGVRVVTKLDPLQELPPESSVDEVRAAVELSINRSLAELKTARLDVVLLHRWAHRHAFGGAIWNRMLEYQASGTIGVLGASVYFPNEAVEALDDPAIGHIQLPFNILDRRWKAGGVDPAARARPDVTIHARSALLQGILAAEPSIWPNVSGVDPIQFVSLLDQLTFEFGREGRADLCLAYVRSQDWIGSTVVGVETMEQLELNLHLFSEPSLTDRECEAAERLLTGAPEELLNPANWKANH